MRQNRYLLPTLKELPSDADTPSAKLMLRMGMIRKVAAGLYEWLPLGLRALRKVEKIVREEMDRAGGQEVWLPLVQPKELWEESGRWAVYGKEMLRFKDRKDTEFCLAPTAEEVITDLVRREVRSYRELPLLLYQFGTKFRDEIRPRFGVMRAREFYMKDAYSFHADDADAETMYKNVFEAYTRIFTRCGLRCRPVQANSGAIGGNFSHEFMVLAETGEDTLGACPACAWAANAELDPARPTAVGDPCPQCGKGVELFKGIEVGHTFKLGTKYSTSMNAGFLSEKGEKHPFIMGCYGIGVSRVVAAALEQSHDNDGALWPEALAPFDVHVLPLNTSVPAIMETAATIEKALAATGYDVLLDDRDARAGVKFKDADLLGLPWRITVGEKKLAQGLVEIKRRGRPDSRDVAPGEVVPALQNK
jgi:prolyl-tRNA synthetase